MGADSASSSHRLLTMTRTCTAAGLERWQPVRSLHFTHISLSLKEVPLPPSQFPKSPRLENEPEKASAPPPATGVGAPRRNDGSWKGTASFDSESLTPGSFEKDSGVVENRASKGPPVGPTSLLDIERPLLVSELPVGVETMYLLMLKSSELILRTP